MTVRKVDVAVVRASIDKLVSLLTDRSIRVTQRGTKAYVAYRPNGTIDRLNIPYLPDEAPESFVLAVQGFTDHEIGHVLFTDPAIVKKANKMGSVMAGMHNIVEDTYIERMMQQRFQGSRNTLDAVRHFHAYDIAHPKIVEALDKGDMATAKGYLYVLAFRAWSGQTVAKEYLRHDPRIEQISLAIEQEVGTDLLSQLGSIQNSQDSFELAKKVVNRLKESEKPKTPPPEAGTPKPKKGAPAAPPVPPADEDEDEQYDDDVGGHNPDADPCNSDEPDPGSGETGEKSDSEGDSESASSRDDEKDDHEKPTDTKEFTEEQDSFSGDTSGKVSDLDNKEPEQEDEETKRFGEAPEIDEPEDANEEEDKDEDPVGVGAGKGDDEGEIDAPSEEEGEGGKAKPSEGEGSEEPSDSTTRMDGIEPEKEGQVSLDEVFDKFVDFDDALSEGLSVVGKEMAKTLPYSIYSNEWDKVERFSQHATQMQTQIALDRVIPMVAPMVKTLQRSLSARDKVTWNPGQRRGRISAGSLYRTATGDDRVFRQRYETKAQSTAVSLMVDMSGSMQANNRYVSAALAALALSSTLERLKIQNEVIGFTTTTDGCAALNRAANQEDAYYPRGEPLYMPILKGFNERLAFEQQSRIAYLTTYGATEIFRENVDGESLRIAANRLRQVKAERRIVIVLSDGQPACSSMGKPSRETLSSIRTAAGTTDLLGADLKRAVQEVSESGIEVVGIGIQHAGVRNYYPKHVNLSSVAELPTVVVQELSKLLLA